MPAFARLFAALMCIVVLVPRANPAAVDSDVDDPLRETAEPLVAKQQATEAERDRLAAQALFATARMLEQKEDFAGALKYYQRALRFDPGGVAIAREIVPLAFTLGRSSEAVRYALKTAELDPSDATLLQRLAAHLTTQGDFERAIELYEKSLQARPKPGKTADAILLTAQIAKLHVASGNLPEAAAAYRQVMAALIDGQSSTLDTRTRRAILEDAGKTLEVLGASRGGRSKQGAAYDLFGLVMLAGDDLEGAEQAFDQARQISPQDAIDSYQAAQLQARREDWVAALTSLQGYLNAGETARGTAPYDLLKTILTSTGQADTLISRLEASRRDDRSNTPLELYLADQYRANRQWPEARALYERTLQVGPTLQSYRGLIETLRQAKDFDRLTVVLARALAEVRTTELLGIEGAAVLEDTQAVEHVLAQAQKAEPAHEPLTSEELAGLAQFALASKRIEVTNTLYERALETKGADRNLIFRRWALGLLLDDHFDESVRVLKRALNEDVAPSIQAELEFHLAGALEMAGQTDEALEAAKRAVSLASEHGDEIGSGLHRIAARPAWVLYHAKRYAEAETAYKSLIEKFGGDHEDDALRESLRDAKLMLSNIAVIRGDLPEAEEWLEEILDEFPDDVSAHNDLGYLWADQNKHLGRARAMIEKAVAASPENTAYLDSLGWVLYRLGRYQEAIDQLESAVAKETNPDGVMLDHLGDAYLASGMLEKARNAWMRSMDAFDKASEPEKRKAVQQKLERSQPAASLSTGLSSRAA